MEFKITTKFDKGNKVWIILKSIDNRYNTYYILQSKITIRSIKAVTDDILIKVKKDIYREEIIIWYLTTLNDYWYKESDLFSSKALAQTGCDERNEVK